MSGLHEYIYHYQGMCITGLAFSVPGLPKTTSADGSLPCSKRMTILKSVSNRLPLFAQIPSGSPLVSEKTLCRRSWGETLLASISFSKFSQSSLARVQRGPEPDSHGGSSTNVFSRKWLVCTRMPWLSGLRYLLPTGETSRPRLPWLASAMRMCWLDAGPPSFSKVEIASSIDVHSSAMRNSRWIGRRSVFVGRARMAFKQTPKEELLNPILPTMPGYYRQPEFSTTSDGFLRTLAPYLDDHPDFRFSWLGD